VPLVKLVEHTVSGDREDALAATALMQEALPDVPLVRNTWLLNNRFYAMPTLPGAESEGEPEKKKNKLAIGKLHYAF